MTTNTMLNHKVDQQQMFVIIFSFRLMLDIRKMLL